MQAQGEAIRAACDAGHEVAALVAANVHRIAQPVAAVAGPDSRVPCWLGLQSWSQAVGYAEEFARGFHLHLALVDIAFDNDLPGPFGADDIAAVDAFHGKCVDECSNLFEQFARRPRRCGNCVVQHGRRQQDEDDASAHFFMESYAGLICPLPSMSHL